MFLKLLSAKTKIPAAYFFLATIIVLVFILAMGIGSSFISRLIAVVYPAIRSMEALESKEDVDDDK